MIPRVKDLLPIGRFSQVTRFSAKELRLYDEQGLLRPALVERGHDTAGPAREIYLVGPGQVADPIHQRTEVQWPVR